MARVKSTVPARVLDISPFGAQVQAAAALRPGVECDVTIPVEGGDMRIRAIVRRCRAAFVADGGDGGDSGMTYRAGLEFVRCSEEEAARLRATYGSRDQPPSPTAGSARRGPIKIRVNASAIERRLEAEEDAEHGGD